MKRLNIELHNEEFDVEVQYCDKGHCLYDCETHIPNVCNAFISDLL